MTTNLNGTGIRVAQPEALGTNSPPEFEVNPANSSVQQPVTLFTYIYQQWQRECFSKLLWVRNHLMRTPWRPIFMDHREAWPPMSRMWTITMQIIFRLNFHYRTNYTARSGNIGDSVVNQSFIFVDVQHQ